jgi:flagellar assembly protein FliH
VQQFAPVPVEEPDPEIERMMQQAQSALAEADAVLQTARRQAKEMIIEAQKNVDEMILEGQKELEDEAQALREQTRAEAEQARQEIEQVREGYEQEAASYLHVLQSIVNQASQWKQDLLTEGEPYLLDLLKVIAGKVFGQGVQLNDAALQHNLNRLLDHSRSLGDIQIFLNPQDVATLSPAWRETRSAITGERIQILPSEEILPGGSLINGKLGTIDARVETQLESVFAVLVPEPEVEPDAEEEEAEV